MAVAAAPTSLVKSGTPRCQRWSFSRPLYTTFPKTAMLPDLHSAFPAEIKDIKAESTKGNLAVGTPQRRSRKLPRNVRGRAFPNKVPPNNI